MFTLSLLLSGNNYADNIGVIYPEIREPYLQIFLNIKEGVEKEIGQKDRVLEYVVSKGESPEKVQRWIKKKKISAVIALGSRGINSIAPPNSIPSVVGAAVLKPGSTSYSGITLNPAPDVLLSTLVKLKPSIKTFHVVYEPKVNEWVIEKAQAQLKKNNIELIPHAVDDLRSAAAEYKSIQNRMDNKTEAIWLPMGGPSREKSLMQSILATAWSKDQSIISSNLSDVKRGALFSMYPDNVAMGRELGKLLKERQENPDAENQVVFVRSLLQAINIRTAEHIGLRFGKEELRQFEFVYPPQ
ncbi:MAG: ABC transporter substrate binding protein [Cellvibrionaceae bacterium]